MASETLVLVFITIPAIPVSVNHYKLRTRQGVTFVSKEAKAFKMEVCWAAVGKSLCANKTKSELRKLKYELEATVFLGEGQKGDGDNFWKCLADGLKEAKVIHSDAAVSDWIMRVRRDRQNPRTEITARVVQ